MADLKISQLSVATIAPALAYIPIAASGANWAIPATPAAIGAAAAANGVTNGDSHDHSGGDGAQIAHTALSSIGTNTHAQIDSHISSTSNPHSVTLAQVGFVSETEQTGTSYTFVLADNFTVVSGNNAAAIAFTVPPNSSVAFPTGSVIGIRQKGAGQITITAGVGVTLNAPGSALKTLRQYSEASIRKIATDTWTVIGELTV